MNPAAAFLSFATVRSGRHHEYNAWHQLDHRPENLALDGVLHGERWVRTSACAADYPVADPVLHATHYVNSYWFRAPVEVSFAEWQALAEQSFQAGRRPDVRIATRPMMGTFVPVTGLASDHALVSPRALLHRPATGVVLTLHRLLEPRDPLAETWLGECERAARERIDLPGVAGVWTLSSSSTTLDPGWQPRAGSMTFDPGSDPGRIRAEITFLDEEPADVVRTLPGLAPRAGSPRPEPDEPQVAEELFTSLLLPITAWAWDWFEV